MKYLDKIVAVIIAIMIAANTINALSIVGWRTSAVAIGFYIGLAIGAAVLARAAVVVWKYSGRRTS